jgi:hypothetical protein
MVPLILLLTYFCFIVFALFKMMGDCINLLELINLAECLVI